MNIYNPGSCYELIPVQHETDEYIFIKQCLEEIRCEGANSMFRLESLNVYRIKDNHLLDNFDEKSNNLILLHATSRTQVVFLFYIVVCTMYILNMWAGHLWPILADSEPLLLLIFNF